MFVARVAVPSRGLLSEVFGDRPWAGQLDLADIGRLDPSPGVSDQAQLLAAVPGLPCWLKVTLLWSALIVTRNMVPGGSSRGWR
jgi:hypothetical protein